MVYGSWKRSLRRRSPELSTTDYYRVMNAVCDEILAGFPDVYVACSPEDENVILGWLCAEATDSALILWMAYTVYVYRGEKVARRLVEHAMRTLNDRAGPDTVYCPEDRRLGQKLHNELGAKHLGWARAMRLREQSTVGGGRG